jgi:hypothetical protein
MLWRSFCERELGRKSASGNVTDISKGVFASTFVLHLMNPFLAILLYAPLSLFLLVLFAQSPTSLNTYIGTYHCVPSLAHMDDTILMTITFFFLATTIYIILSTLHIHSPLPSSTTIPHEPQTHDPNPPANTSAEFLFRIANLHIYGIRSLFIAAVVGGSTLAAAGVVYCVLALRSGLVKWDMSEEWRQPFEGADTRHDDLQHRWEVIAEGADSSTSTSIPKAMSDSESSRYGIPRNSYMSNSKRQPVVRFQPDGVGPSRSSGIPSYYFKEHDDEGRSVTDEMRPSSEMKALKRNDSVGGLDAGGGLMPTSGAETATGAEGCNDSDQEVPYRSRSSIADHQATRSLPGSAPGSEGGRRRHVQGAPCSTASDSGTSIANGAMGQAGQARRIGDDGWDAVYCSGWKGMD